MKPKYACKLDCKTTVFLWLAISGCASQQTNYKAAYTAADHEEIARQLDNANIEEIKKANNYQLLLEKTERIEDDGKLPYELSESYRALAIHYRAAATNSAKMAALHREIAALMRTSHLSFNRTRKP